MTVSETVLHTIIQTLLLLTPREPIFTLHCHNTERIKVQLAKNNSYYLSTSSFNNACMLKTSITMTFYFLLALPLNAYELVRLLTFSHKDCVLPWHDFQALFTDNIKMALINWPQCSCSQKENFLTKPTRVRIYKYEYPLSRTAYECTGNLIFKENLHIWFL